MTLDMDELWKFADLVKKVASLDAEGRNYGANIIDELHAGENAHSRILGMLLKYDDGSKTYPVLKSFLKSFVPGCSLEPEKPRITMEEERIDVLIEESPKYGIIIENKVNGAVDQDGQIERYIEVLLENHGINSEHIYAIYLTRDGGKEVSECSLTDKAKGKLRYKSPEERGNFIPLDYRHHILPWLENRVLPNCMVKEELFVSAVRQYIDYLKGMFGIRYQNEEKRIEIMEKIKKALDIKDLKSCEGAYLQFRNILAKIEDIRTVYAKAAIEKDVIEPIRSFLEEKNIPFDKVKQDDGNNYENVALDIDISGWSKANIRLRQEGGKLYYGVSKHDINVHVDIREDLKSKLDMKGYRPTDWWLAWHWLPIPLRYPGKEEFWAAVENGNFAEVLKNAVSEMYDLFNDSLKEQPA